MDAHISDHSGVAIRVLVIDDLESVRVSLHQCVDAFTDLEWVGEASEALEGLELCERLRPHVVLLDASLPHVDIARLTSLIRRCFPETQVIGTTGFEEPAYRDRMLNAGAALFISKQGAILHLAEIVRRAVSRSASISQ